MKNEDELLDMEDDIGSIKNKLGILNYVIDKHENAHIIVDPEICKKCPHHLCISGCPTRCFNFFKMENGKSNMVFTYEDCIECGTCDIMCDQGAISWDHPKGSFGIQYEHG